MDKTAIGIIIGVVLLGAIFWIWQAGSSVTPVSIPGGIILFYGEGCSHCKIVDDYINENNIKEKVDFVNLEVWYNKNNQNILTQVVQKCNIQTDQVGVPFLYDGDNQRCLMGQDEVIDFFKQKAGL